MIAPRKTLWSTPLEVVDRVIQLVPLAGPNDDDDDDAAVTAVVCDVGCGDGRPLLRWAAAYSKLQSQLAQSDSDSDSCDDGDSDSYGDFDGKSSSSSPSSRSSSESSVAALPVRRRRRWRRQQARSVAQSPGLHPSFVGIDVDENRIREARNLLKEARRKGDVFREVKVEFHCANALDCAHLFRDVTVFFLYLVPRGLRIIKPLLIQGPVPQDGGTTDKGRQETDTTAAVAAASERTTQVVRVVTYMSPLEGETPLRKELVEVPHQPGSRWPLYLYELTRTNMVEEGS